LKKEDMPDSLNNMEKSTASRQNLCDMMYVGLEDEALQRYKESLLGNLADQVRESVKRPGSILRKSNQVKVV
jgi:hypothetical protein